MLYLIDDCCWALCWMVVGHSGHGVVASVVGQVTIGQDGHVIVDPEWNECCISFSYRMRCGTLQY